MAKVIKPWKEIPLTEAAKTALANLPAGMTMALRMRHVNSSKEDLPKVQIEFAEKIVVENRAITAAGLFNAKDDRFSSGAQRAWETADLSIAEQMFGKIPDGQASVEILKQLKPEGGKQFRIQLTEVVESELNDTELQYPENYLKRAGVDGNYFYTPSGERVASRKRLVIVAEGTDPVNTYIEAVASKEPANNGLAGVLTGSKPAVHSDVTGD